MSREIGRGRAERQGWRAIFLSPFFKGCSKQPGRDDLTELSPRNDNFKYSDPMDHRYID